MTANTTVISLVDDEDEDIVQTSIAPQEKAPGVLLCVVCWRGQESNAACRYTRKGKC